MIKKLRFKLFGGISVFSEHDKKWHSLSEYTGKGIGKKQQAFLTYLLLNHGRKIAATELMEHFWDGDGAAPANSLKNMLHKIRSILKAIDPEYEDLIVTQTGGYAWNKDYEIDLDVDALEQMYRNMNCATEQGQDQAMAAVELYGGDILPGMNVEWLDHINTYYRTIYIDICKNLSLHLQEVERWSLVLQICKQAYTLAPEVEEFTLCAMNALIATGVPKQAIKHYEDYKAMLWTEYNLIPSARVEHLHTIAVELYKGEGEGEELLVQKLTEMSDETGAFQCSLLVFQNFVQLELRNMNRNKTAASIVLLRQETIGMKYPSATDIRRIERILNSSLRAGDPFTRLNRGSFALLLPGATSEDAKKVMERIDKDFYSTYPRSKATLNYQIYAMEVE